MEVLLNRYRNLLVLLVVIAAQVVLLAYQVKSSQDVRLIRVWAVTAVTPLARLLEGLRSGTVGAVRDYFLLQGVRSQNQELKQEIGKLKLENQFLKNELATAERARALGAFQARTPSRTIAARIIGAATGTNSRVVYVDRGSSSGVMKGMAVVTPDGIVGRVTSVYPTASQVRLVTDPNFAAGVISQKSRVKGTLKGQGHSTCMVDYVQIEEKVEQGEWFYTSGDDRIFPRGLPVGVATVVRNGPRLKEIFISPSGFQAGLEEVLIVLEGVHEPVPAAGEVRTDRVYLMPPPPPEPGAASNSSAQPISPLSTDADRLRQRYQRIGEAQGHKFGEGTPGSRPPNFNLDPSQLPPRPQPTPPPAAPETPANPNP